MWCWMVWYRAWSLCILWSYEKGEIGKLQWSKKAKEIVQRECIGFNVDFINNIHKTFNDVNEKRKEYGLEPKRRITRDIVEQTILNIVCDSLVGGDIQKQENIFAFDEVMFQ